MSEWSWNPFIEPQRHRWQKYEAVSFKAPPTAGEALRHVHLHVHVPQHASAKDVTLASWHKMASQELKPAHSDADRMLFIIQEPSRVARPRILQKRRRPGGDSQTWKLWVRLQWRRFF